MNDEKMAAILDQIDQLGLRDLETFIDVSRAGVEQDTGVRLTSTAHPRARFRDDAAQLLSMPEQPRAMKAWVAAAALFLGKDESSL